MLKFKFASLYGLRFTVYALPIFHLYRSQCSAMAPMPSLNDGILLTSLLYLSIDMQSWDEFANCEWPVNRWLFVSYFFILGFRLSHILGTMHTAGSGDFLLNLRHKDRLPHFLMLLTWLGTPLFAVWTGVGTYWFFQSRRMSSQCLPMGSTPLYFIFTWLFLSYAWIIIHFTLGGVAWALERRICRAEDSLRAMESSDTLARWGQVSQLAGYTALANNPFGGLKPEESKALPEMPAELLHLDENSECSICLSGFCAHDEVRQLGTCGHTFHRSCIDLWLLRSEHCPLCKQSVVVKKDAQQKQD